MKIAVARRALVGLLALTLTGPALAATQLTGAGATFPYPFFSKAFYEYSQTHKDVTVNYQSIGSGGGIQQFTQKTVDFGASDVPMNVDELKTATAAGGPVLQFPDTLGGEAIAYNIPGIKTGMKLTRQIVADIYLGNIKTWNDPAIAKINPDLKLPATPIVAVNRSDGSGTTYIFTDFLSNVSTQWKAKVGAGKSVEWPAPSSVGGKGNEGVAGVVRQTPGAIGYLELAYVLENAIPYAQLQNKAGKYLLPTTESIRAAAASKPNCTPTNFSIVDTSAPDAYPIVGYSWMMVFQKPADKARAKMVRDVLTWLVTQGQPIAASVKYVPLPDIMQKQAISTLQKMDV